jgi:hypothetical protein
MSGTRNGAIERIAIPTAIHATLFNPISRRMASRLAVLADPIAVG